MDRVFSGPFVHALAMDKLELVEHGAIGVSAEGTLLLLPLPSFPSFSSLTHFFPLIFLLLIHNLATLSPSPSLRLAHPLSAGKIVFVARSSSEAASLIAQHGVSTERVESLGARFLVPGFVDTHVHAPQYSFTGAHSASQ